MNITTEDMMILVKHWSKMEDVFRDFSEECQRAKCSPSKALALVLITWMGMFTASSECFQEVMVRATNEALENRRIVESMFPSNEKE